MVGLSSFKFEKFPISNPSLERRGKLIPNTLNGIINLPSGVKNSRRVIFLETAIPESLNPGIAMVLLSPEFCVFEAINWRKISANSFLGCTDETLYVDEIFPSDTEKVSPSFKNWTGAFSPVVFVW